ncbi:MAG: hypothetical protein ACJ8FN_12580 [Sphingomicrobium sp.]
MPGDHDLPDASYAEVNSKLSEGIESCRSVVANYRMLLTSHDADAANDDSPDEPESAGAPAD